MRRREFVTLLGSVATTWPLVARAQPSNKVRRVGILITLPENDSEGQARIGSLRDGLKMLDWIEGRNIQFDYRWSSDDANRLRSYAAELVKLAPDVIFANPAPTVEVLQRLTTTIPIVFVTGGDPVRAGFVKSLARPGGNATGFQLFEATINTKYVQLLKDIAPNVTRVAVIQNVGSGWRGDYAGIDAAARSFAMQAIATPVRNAADIELAISEFGRKPNGSLILPPDSTTIRHRELIVTLAARHRLPAVYSGRFFVKSGGLISYSVDEPDIFRRAASYIDRILRGTNPADLPVQTPTKFELVINLKTAKALGLNVPLLLQQLANEVIE